MTELALKNIHKSFRDTVVLRDLTITVHAGEFFTFVGPSGCGKSTILNLIAGLEPATGGEILFDGRPVSRLTPMERDVAMIFQSYALYPHMTAYENIAFPLRMRKERAGRIDSEVRRVADMLGLGEYLFRKPKELSGGQRQRVALGRAVVRKPKLFLLDEPLSNLDAKLRLDMRAELKKLHRELGITTVYVTHDQSEAMGLSDRIAVLEKGELQQCDIPREVYRHPANTFVAGFIGNPPMNLLRCTVVSRSPLELDCNGVRIAPRLDAAPSSDEVIVGIRPEDITVAREQDKATFVATVSMIEPAGSTAWIGALWGMTPIRAVAGSAEVIREGAEARFALSPDRISVFDEATGRVLM